MRPSNVLASAFLFAAASTAWPSLRLLGSSERDVEIEPLLVARATTYDLSYSATEGETDAVSSTTTDDSSATSTDSSATTTDASSDASQTGSSTGQSSGSTTAKATTKTSSGSKTTATTSSNSTTSVAATDGAGGVSMISPDPLSSSSYYKIKDYVTFAWNYTSLAVTPTAVDILASCSANDATYTIALNQSVTGATQAVTWDTGAYQATATLPLLTETYTLIIYDAAKAVSATAAAGYLGTWDSFTFGMYTPQPYTPMADWVCATCSGALSSMERQNLYFLFGMAGITIFSFGWFGGVAGVF